MLLPKLNKTILVGCSIYLSMNLLSGDKLLCVYLSFAYTLIEKLILRNII